MKLFSLLATLCICQLALAQPETSFLGSITYTVKAPEKASSAEEMRMIIHFGPNKLYLQMLEDGKSSEDEILIDLDSGKLYTIMHAYKSYKVQKLATARPPKQGEALRSVLGHAVELMPVAGASPTSSLLRMLPMSGNLYVAKDLVFRIPRQYAATPELMMIVNDHILLKAELDMGNWMGAYSREDDEADPHTSSMTFQLEAAEVNNTPPPASRFRLPEGYTMRKRNDYSYMIDSLSYDTTMAYADSAAVMVDTAAYTTDFYPGERVVPVEVISDEGKVEYDTVWLSSNREYPTYGVDYKIVGRWVPKRRSASATSPKTSTKSPARKPKKS